MEITINGYTISNYNDVTISLRYNSIADTFGFSIFADPTNPYVRSALKPLTYPKCTITHNGQTLITGVLTSHTFSDSAVPSLTNIGGYSTTGILADCQLFTFKIAEGTEDAKGSIEFTNQSLFNIAGSIISGLGLGIVIVDANVENECNKIYNSIAADPTEKIADFLDRMATQRGVVLSHTIGGQVLFTKSKTEKNTATKQTLVPVTQVARIPGKASAPNFVASGNSIVNFDSKPIYNFSPGQTVCTRMELKINGQAMHSYIEVLAQAPIDEQGNIGQPARSAVSNPFVKNTFRYARKVQTSGYDTDTPGTARATLGDELSNITLSIDIVGWELNGKLVQPNSIITVINPVCYLYKATRFFIEGVTLKGDAKGRTATLSCVLPFVYNDEDVVNIFD